MALKIPDPGNLENIELNYKDLVKKINEGLIQIPDFQREFVWTPQKILDLLDSINKGYPLGSLIFWVTSKEFSQSKPISKNPDKSNVFKSDFFVIDGQQRLKSLYAAAKTKELEGIKKKIDVLYSLEEKKFVFRDDLTKERRRSCFPITDVNIDKDIINNVLKAIENNQLENYISEKGYPERPIRRFLDSLESLGLITSNHDLTNFGEDVLKKDSKEKIAHELFNNVDYIKDVLEILRKNPGIKNMDAVSLFRNIFGGSFATAYQQFRRRMRWLRALNLIYRGDSKKGGYPYHLSEEGEKMLDFFIEKEKEENTKYIPLETILSENYQDYEHIVKFPEEKRKEIWNIKERFSKFNFSIIVVNKEDWEEVCDIFERINTAGQELNVVDLMIAKTWEEGGFNLREKLNEFEEEMGGYLPDKSILQTISLNISNRCRRKDILALDKKSVKDNWEDTKECIRKSIDFIKSDLNIISLELLPYPATLVPIANFYYLMENREPTEKQKKKLKEFFWKANFSNRFDSAVEDKLEKDSERMKKLSKEEEVEFNYSYVPRTIGDIKEQKYSLGNAFSKSILCLYSSIKPLNIVNNSEIKSDNFSKYSQSQMHHVFPINYLRREGFGDDKIHSIANIMFLPANINNSKPFKSSPKKYLQSIENEKLSEALKTHLIHDIEESGLLENDFEKFLDYRSRNILNKIKSFIGDFSEIEEGMLEDENEQIEDFEKKIRKFIQERLSEQGREDLKDNLNENLVQKIEERIKEYKRKNPSLQEEINLLDFCDIMDYYKIIKQNWDVFEKYFGSKTELEKHLLNINEFRNSVKHSRKISSTTRKLAEGSLIWFEDIFQ